MHFGASKVIAVGRNAARLDSLDAEVKIPLDDEADQALRAQFDQGVDVVLDFTWGELAVRTLRAATKDRGSRTGEPRIRYLSRTRELEERNNIALVCGTQCVDIAFRILPCSTMSAPPKLKSGWPCVFAKTSAISCACRPLPFAKGWMKTKRWRKRIVISSGWKVWFSSQ